jgi:hypothetical protein
MCAACAVTAVAAASGTRSWLQARGWLSPRGLRVASAVLLFASLAVMGVRP